MPLKFKELTKYSIKDDCYPNIITKEVIYENQNSSYRLTTKEDLAHKTIDFIEDLWRKTRNKYIRFLKSSFLYLYVLTSKTEKITIYSIDCTPHRHWFLENEITDELKTSKCRFFIKQSTIIDIDLLNYENKKLKITKNVLKEKLKGKFTFYINDIDLLSSKKYISFESYHYFFHEIIYLNPIEIIRYFMLGVIRYCKSIGTVYNLNFNKYYVKGVPDNEEKFVILDGSKEGIVEIVEDYFIESQFRINFCMHFSDFEKEIISDKCVICLDGIPDMYLTACGHVCICKECREQLEDGPIKCPLCRKLNRIILNK